MHVTRRTPVGTRPRRWPTKRPASADERSLFLSQGLRCWYTARRDLQTYMYAVEHDHSHNVIAQAKNAVCSTLGSGGSQHAPSGALEGSRLRAAGVTARIQRYTLLWASEHQHGRLSVLRALTFILPQGVTQTSHQQALCELLAAHCCQRCGQVQAVSPIHPSHRTCRTHCSGAIVARRPSLDKAA